MSKPFVILALNAIAQFIWVAARCAADGEIPVANFFVGFASLMTAGLFWEPTQ